jgi:hypothetical protein
MREVRPGALQIPKIAAPHGAQQVVEGRIEVLMMGRKSQRWVVVGHVSSGAQEDPSFSICTTARAVPRLPQHLRAAARLASRASPTTSRA